MALSFCLAALLGHSPNSRAGGGCAANPDLVLPHAAAQDVSVRPAEHIGATINPETLILGGHAAAQVVDAPRFAWRGVLLDVGRHFFPVPFILKVLDVCAFYKISRFHWHLTEDQARLALQEGILVWGLFQKRNLLSVSLGPQGTFPPLQPGACLQKASSVTTGPRVPLSLASAASELVASSCAGGFPPAETGSGTCRCSVFELRC